MEQVILTPFITIQIQIPLGNSVAQNFAISTVTCIIQYPKYQEETSELAENCTDFAIRQSTQKRQFWRADVSHFQVVFYGTSAGAMGVAFNCDAVAEILKAKFPNLDVSIHLILTIL